MINYILGFSIGVVVYYILKGLFVGVKLGNYTYKGSSEKFALLYATIVPLVESGTMEDIKRATNKIDILITYMKTNGDARLIKNLHVKIREKIKEWK